MKQLKKHPKQQRMEDMKIPGYFYIPNGSSKRSKLTLAGLEKEEKAIKKAVKNITGFSGGATVDIISGKNKATWDVKDDQVWTKVKQEEPDPMYQEQAKDKVTWEGREYLRSINNEHHHWHLLAGLILIGSIVASAYILTHGLVCAPASFEGKTVINCFRK